MARSAHTTPLPVATADEAFAALREHGLRVSSSRRAVLDALFATDDPQTADQIAEHCGGDVASVYRNLDAFEELGLVRHVHLGHGPGCYSLAGAAPREYLVCELCGMRRSVEPEQLDEVRALIAREFGLDAKFTHFPIVGVCAACQNTHPS